MTDILSVALGARGYDIRIGRGLIATAGEAIEPFAGGRPVIVVTDETVAGLHLAPLVASLDDAGVGHVEMVVPTGEAAKDFSELERLLEAILATRPERGSLIVALGGGVVGDLAGFAASIILRGVDFIQIPTTLLAQVDSSVGGKTAINSRNGKNLIGAFHQPRLVLADTDVLATLPPREMRAGYAEVAKYGLLGDADFFAWLEQNGGAVCACEPEATRHAVLTSCAAKAAIVADDEREQGRRALLNLGHTFGHALEAETGFGGALLHGEAVGLGMVLAFELSARMGLCPMEDAARVRRHLAKVGLPATLDEVGGGRMSVASLLDHMHGDKKVRGGKPTFILARGIGQAFITGDVDMSAVADLLEQAIAA